MGSLFFRNYDIHAIKINQDYIKIRMATGNLEAVLYPEVDRLKECWIVLLNILLLINITPNGRET